MTDSKSTAGKGLLKSEQKNNIIMARERELNMATHAQTAVEKISTPRTDAARNLAIEYHAKSLDLDFEDSAAIAEYLKEAPPDGWDTARQLERELEAINPAVKELERNLAKEKVINSTLGDLLIEQGKQLSDSESARARVVEALKKWHRNTGGQCIECNQGGVHVPFIDHDDDCSIGQALSTQPPIKTVDEQDTTSTCPVCGRTAKEGCVGWHPTEKLLEETK